MMFATYTRLRLVRQKTYKTTNFIFQNVSNISKFCTSSTTYNTENKDPKKIVEDSYVPENVTTNSIGYVNKLKNDIPENSNVDKENVSGTIELSNKRAHGITLLNKNKYEFNEALEDIDIKSPEPLDPCHEDLSDVGRCITPTFNFAKYADNSHTIQQLVNLGVNLYKLEHDREITELFMSLDFDKHMKPYIQFLHDCGVPPDNLGYFITKNPRIFKQDMDDLHTRIRYLKVHNFKDDMITSIISRNPLWLSFNTEQIDTSLGYFQYTFDLNASTVRKIVLRKPQLITYDMKHIKTMTFSVKEEMGFCLNEMQLLLVKIPKMWLKGRYSVLKTFDYAHNIMKLQHAFISEHPKILLCRKNRLQARHQFLVELKKNQYNPLEPLYISPEDLIGGNDIEFCENVAKTSIDTYNLFLKTF